MFLRNAGNNLRDYKASQPQSTFSCLWKPQFSERVLSISASNNGHNRKCLFYFYGLLNDEVGSPDCIPSDVGILVNDCKECRRNRSWPNLRKAYYPGIFSEGLRNTSKIPPGQPVLGRRFNLRPPELEGQCRTLVREMHEDAGFVLSALTEMAAIFFVFHTTREVYNEIVWKRLNMLERGE